MRRGNLVRTLVVALACGATASAEEANKAESHPAVAAKYRGGQVTWAEFEREVSRMPPVLRDAALAGGGGELLAQAIAFRHHLVEEARKAGLIELAKVEVGDPELRERMAIRMLLGGEVLRGDAAALDGADSPEGVVQLDRLHRVFNTLYRKLTANGGVQVDPATRGRLDIEYKPAANEGGPVAGSRTSTLQQLSYRLSFNDPHAHQCEVLIDSEHRRVLGSCNGEDMEKWLTGPDLLFFELYLSGDGANILYRYNFDGLTLARAIVAAPAQFIAPALGVVERVGQAETKGRPFVERARAHCTVSPRELEEGTIKFCQTEECEPMDVIKAATVSYSRGEYVLRAISSSNDMSASDIVDAGPTGVEGAHRFSVPLPVHVVHFDPLPIRPEAPKGVWCRLEPVNAADAPVVKGLGLPRGTIGP